MKTLPPHLRIQLVFRAWRTRNEFMENFTNAQSYQMDLRRLRILMKQNPSKTSIAGRELERLIIQIEVYEEQYIAHTRKIT